MHANKIKFCTIIIKLFLLVLNNYINIKNKISIFNYI